MKVRNRGEIKINIMIQQYFFLQNDKHISQSLFRMQLLIFNNIFFSCKSLIVFVALFFMCGTQQAFADSRVRASVQNVAYTIQVGSFKNLENAGKLVDDLNKKGLDAFFFKDHDMYKVRFGNYQDSLKARKVALMYQEQKLIGDFFIISPQSYMINQKHMALQKNTSVREQLIHDAYGYLGVPYKWGGTSSTSGFDCSGLVRAVYRLNGLTLPRTTKEQFGTGKFVLKKDLQVGDLVFFTTDNGTQVNHVGIYIGDGEFIHAPGKGKDVRKAPLHSQYWNKVYKGARTYID